MRYRTEIFVTADRYVCLQLPDFLPEGRAMVTVIVEDHSEQSRPEIDVDRQDMEWWEEFDEEVGRRS